jgi:hypothetical protein
MISGLVPQPHRPELVKPAAADLQAGAGAGGIQFAGIESAQDATDVSFRNPAADLFFSCPGA